MAKLILSMDGLVLKEIPLLKERTTIGRKPHNDIQIDNLAVSGEHAVIVTIMNDCFLEDLGSTNGTLINGAPAKKHFLQNNDVIELGKYKLKFIGEVAAPAAATDFEKTMVLRPAAMRQAADQARAVAAAPREQDRHPSGCRAPAARRPPKPARCSARSDSFWRQRGRNWSHQAAHHARQAGHAGRRADAPAARLFHHHVEGAKPTVGGIDRRVRALRIRPDRLAGVKMEFFLKS